MIKLTLDLHGKTHLEAGEEVRSTLFSASHTSFEIDIITGNSDAMKEVACGSFKTKQPPEIKGAGFVVESLEAAIWAFYHTDNFRDGALKAVNLGDDADTTGAVYGQIAGAIYDMPQEWLQVISMREKITEISNQLLPS